MSWRAPVLLALGLAVGILALGGTFSNYGGYTLRAEFADASGLRSEFFVRIDGVDVGHVTSVTVSPRYTAIVTMHLSSTALPIGRNATATIRPDSFFGEHYVAIDPGDREDPAPSGTLIPLTRTGTTTELDQLFDTFDPRTRLALGVFLNETGQMLVGRGQDLATTLSLLPGTLSDAQMLIANFGADDRALGDLVDRSSQIVAAITPQRAALGRLIGNASAALAATAARGGDLSAAIVDAPGAIGRLRDALVSLQSAAGQLGGAAAGLRATAAPLTGVLQELPAFAAAARPALRSVDIAAPLLTELADRGAPVVRRLAAPTRELASFSQALAPVSSALNASLANLLGYLEGYARAMQDEDGAGHLYRPAQTYDDLSAQSVQKIADRAVGLRRQPATRAAGARHAAGTTSVSAPTPAGSSTPGGGTHHAPLPTLPLPALSAPSPPTPTGGVAPAVAGLLHYLLGR